MNQHDDEPKAGAADHLRALPQNLMPGHLLSRLMFGFTRIRYPAIKNRFIDWFIDRFNVDMSEAAEQDPHAYEHFNAFFTRPLRDGARTIDSSPDTVVCPVDGTGSQAGLIRDGRLFQAKGRDFSLQELVGGDPALAEPFAGGHFTTIYLSPRDYHRIHMPVTGTLRTMVHVPGRLFSVSPATTRVIPELFARNERVIAFFDTELGPMAVVLVGAVFVAGIETVWSGLVTPPAGRVVQTWRYRDEEAITLQRGEELGRFNMGSTVILLFGPDVLTWRDTLRHGAPVRLGEAIGDRRSQPPHAE